MSFNKCWWAKCRAWAISFWLKIHLGPQFKNDSKKTNYYFYPKRKVHVWKGLKPDAKVKINNRRAPVKDGHDTKTPWCRKNLYVWLSHRWKHLLAADVVSQLWLGWNGRRGGQPLQSWSHCAHLRLSLVTSARSHLPRLLVPPCFCGPFSPSALPAAHTGGSLYPPGNSCGGNTHDTLKREKKKKKKSQLGGTARWTQHRCVTSTEEPNMLQLLQALTSSTSLPTMTWCVHRTANHNQPRGRQGVWGEYKREKKQQVGAWEESKGRKNADSKRRPTRPEPVQTRAVLPRRVLQLC